MANCFDGTSYNNNNCTYAACWLVMEKKWKDVQVMALTAELLLKLRQNYFCWSPIWFFRWLSYFVWSNLATWANQSTAANNIMLIIHFRNFFATNTFVPHSEPFGISVSVTSVLFSFSIYLSRFVQVLCASVICTGDLFSEVNETITVNRHTSWSLASRSCWRICSSYFSLVMFFWRFYFCFSVTSISH